MNNQNVKKLAIMGLFLLLSTVAAHGQTGAKVEANVPFDFVAGEVTFKAGEYSIKRYSKDTLLVSSAGRKTRIIVPAPETVAQTRHDAPQRLVFHRYGDEYFLAQVWLSNDADGRGLFSSKAERQRARELAKDKGRRAEVEISARGN